MTDETQTTVTQDQQDQTTVTALEAKVEQDAANLALDQDALVHARAELEKPVALETSAEPALSSEPASTLIASTISEPDALDTVFAAGIAEYNGYPEHEDKIKAIRELQSASVSISPESRAVIAKMVAQ